MKKIFAFLALCSISHPLYAVYTCSSEINCTDPSHAQCDRPYNPEILIEGAVDSAPVTHVPLSRVDILNGKTKYDCIYTSNGTIIHQRYSATQPNGAFSEEGSLVPYGQTSVFLWDLAPAPSDWSNNHLPAPYSFCVPTAAGKSSDCPINVEIKTP